MAVPKKKVSQSRRDKRRSHLALNVVGSVKCENCGNDRLPHHICRSCGYYNKRQVFTKINNKNTESTENIEEQSVS